MKKKLLILLTFIFFMPLIIKAEEIKLEWEREFGGYNQNIIKTSDNGYLILGVDSLYESTYNGTEPYIKKYNENFDLMWDLTFSGSQTFTEFLKVVETFDNEFVIVGRDRGRFDDLEKYGSIDALIIKVDKAGNLIWKKNYGGEKNDQFNNICIDENGDIIVSGLSEDAVSGKRNIILIKYDKSGNVLFEQIITSEYGFYNEELLVKNNEIIVGAQLNKSEYFTEDIIIFKYDKFGNKLWENIIGGSSMEFIGSLLVLDTNEILVSGSTSSEDIEGINAGLFIIKYDKDGNILWKKSFTGGNVYNMFEKKDAIILLDMYNSSSKIVKIDKDGNIIWEDSLNAAFVPQDVFLDNNDNVIVITYEYNQDAFVNNYRLKKYNQNGEKLFDDIFMSGSKDLSIFDNNKLFVEKDNKISKYVLEYKLNNIIQENNNGTFTSEQQGVYGVIKTAPNQGYEVDQIIIKDKDGNVLDLELTSNQDGTYSFDLYTDVSVEVTYKQKIENPKTGILDVATILILGFIISVIGIFTVKIYNERLEM